MNEKNRSEIARRVSSKLASNEQSRAEITKRVSSKLAWSKLTEAIKNIRFPERISIDNLAEIAPKGEVRITNLKDIPAPPSEVTVKNLKDLPAPRVEVKAPTAMPKTLLSQSFELRALPGQERLVLMQGVKGKRIFVYAFSFMVGGGGFVQLRGPASLNGPQNFRDAQGTNMHVTPPAFLFATDVGVDLSINVTAGGRAGGFISFFVE